MTTDKKKQEQIETARILDKMCEPGAIMALASDLDKAVVMRESQGGKTNKTAIVNRQIAMDMAMRGLINSPNPSARVAKYTITAQGRWASVDKAQTDAPPKIDEGGEDANTPLPRNYMRPIQTESPLSVLARRMEKDGSPFLHRSLVAAGAQLFEDFEVSRIETTAYESVLERAIDNLTNGHNPYAESPLKQATNRVEYALFAMGYGLADIAFRCCCLQEGFEAAEKDLNWSSRSGKIVLRIALQHLADHYKRERKEPMLIG